MQFLLPTMKFIDQEHRSKTVDFKTNTKIEILRKKIPKNAKQSQIVQCFSAERGSDT